MYVKAWIFPFIKIKRKQEVHHIAIFNNVVFSLCTHLASFFRAWPFLTQLFHKLFTVGIVQFSIIGFNRGANY